VSQVGLRVMNLKHFHSLSERCKHIIVVFLKGVEDKSV
jgi:hypothetical protein